MRRSFGKSLTTKKWVWFVLVYLTATGVVFVQRKLNAGAEPRSDRSFDNGSTDRFKNTADAVEVQAFWGAPPVIPHDIEDQKDARDCLRCHLHGAFLEDGRVAQPTPHPQLASCLQCHVPAASGGFPLAQPKHWQGRRGKRWFPVSPPTVPHPVFLHENCLACHGPMADEPALRTTHPERSQCLQCHVPDATQEWPASPFMP